MSTVYGGLQRSDRLLPLESCEVLANTDHFRLHVLDKEHDAKLHEHVSFYWDQQRDYQGYQRRLLREVGSTRGPVRFAGFPQVRQSTTASSTARKAEGSAGSEHTSSASRNVSASLSPSSPLREESGVQGASSLSSTTIGARSNNSSNNNNNNKSDNGSESGKGAVCGEASRETSKWAPPRSLAAWNWVRLVAPYERLLCPTLLFSALLSPAISAPTSLQHGTQPPTAVPLSAPGASPSAASLLSSSPSLPSPLQRVAQPVPARWSSQTCRTLWDLHAVAAATSLPAQEVYVLCAGTLLYLDVVVSSGRVWAELEELWGSDLLAQGTGNNVKQNETRRDEDSLRSGDRAISDDSSPVLALMHDDSSAGNSDDNTRLSETPALAAMQANLSQPPQSYAALLQQVRVLLEAILYVSPATVRVEPPKAAYTSPPRPLLPWLQTAAKIEEWTSTTASSASSARATSASGPSPSAAEAAALSSQPPAASCERHTSVVAAVLKAAVREWLARRGTTVSAGAPTGTRAAALPMRDLTVPRNAPTSLQMPLPTSASQHSLADSRASNTVNVRSALKGGAEESTAPRCSEDGSGNENNSKNSNSTAPRLTSAVNTRDGQRTTNAATASASTAITFDPFEPHDTPRAQHPFHLPPLPQDPALLVFAAVWRRTLRRCVLERDVARQQLRQVILGQAGQRCEELLTAVRQQQQQQQKAEEEQQPKAQPSSGLEFIASGGEAATSAVLAEPSAKETGASEKRARSLSSSSVRSSQASTVASSSSPASPALVTPTRSSHLVLLTSDPTSTSFRVLGPRSGEWLTSRVGAWSGFRGELFCCVATTPRPPPLPYAPSSPSSVNPPRVRPHTPSSAHGAPGTTQRPSPLAPSAPNAEVLRLQCFVDGALELDSSTRTPQHGSTTASPPSPSSLLSSTTPSLAATSSGNAIAAAPYTTEELADRLCRLGAALPRYATEVTGDRLRAVDADFACEVLQQHCLPLFLACKRRGFQQWSLRSFMKGITLTLLDNSGTESRVATPAKLFEVSRRELAAAMGGTEASDTTGALRMLMEGGLSEAVAFFEHVQKRKDRTLRWLPVKRVAAASLAGPAAPIPFSAVEALLLRRAEESAIFSIFQCHPQAVVLGGCGVGRLALHASTHRGSRTSLLLVRSCGVVVEWDVQDCYEPPRHRRLRTPKRLMVESRRRVGAQPHLLDAAEADLHEKGEGSDDAPPPEVGAAVERLTLRHVRGMLQYYRRALLASAAPTANAAAAVAAVSVSVTDEEKDAAVSFNAAEAVPVVSRKRLREEGSVTDDSASALTAGPDGAAAKLEMEAKKTEEKSVDCADRLRTPHELKAQAQCEAKSNTKKSNATPSSGLLSQLSKAPQAVADSTSLFAIDRAVALYVLRHHPQYYTQVAGCGIKDVFVAIKAVSAEDASGASKTGESDTQASPSDARSDGNDALRAASEDLPAHSIGKDADGSSSGSTTAATLSATLPPMASTHSQSPNLWRAVLMVERVCGERVEVDVEACYNKTVEGCPLRPRVILV